MKMKIQISDGGDEPIPMVVGGEKMARLIFDYSRF